MNRKIFALVCAVWIAFLPELALAQSAATQGNDGSPTGSGGVRILGSDGTNDYKFYVGSDGRLQVGAAYPSMEILTHKTNVTVLAAGVDSSTVPFSTAGYRQIFGLLRLKAASFAVSNYIECAVRANFAAQNDSTAIGWWYPLGTGLEHGKTIRLANAPSATNGAYADRVWMIPFTDSLTGTPYQSLYTTVFLRNMTGAQTIYDFWILGVR